MLIRFWMYDILLLQIMCACAYGVYVFLVRIHPTHLARRATDAARRQRVHRIATKKTEHSVVWIQFFSTSLALCLPGPMRTFVMMNDRLC